METIKINIVGGDLVQAHENDLCYDLRAIRVATAEDENGVMRDGEAFPFYLNPGKRVCIDTGVIVNFPENMGSIIKPRSGLAYKWGIDVLAGVIDPGYRDTIKVILVNLGSKIFRIDEGDRIAQLLPLFTSAKVEFVEVEEATETERGLGGFGSTGVK